MIVARKVEYVEVYDIGVSKLTSIRDDLDLCGRILYSADPVLSQRLKSFTEDGKSAVKLINKTFDRVSENPIYPVSSCYLPPIESQNLNNNNNQSNNS